MLEKRKKVKPTGDDKVMKRFEWTPRKQLGPFEFGAFFNKDLLENYSVVEVPEEYNSSVDWTVYKFNQDGRVFLEDDKIVSILSTSEVFYHDKNLVGMQIDQIINLLDSEPDSIESEEMSDGVEYVYEFEQLGLQLWISEGVVVTVIVNDAE